MNIEKALRWASESLTKAGIIDPQREASTLINVVLNKDRAYLIAHSDKDLTPDEWNNFASIVDRRSAHEPLQYITGRQEFCGHYFEIVPGVLIPRPETEMLVDAAVEHLRGLSSPRFIEVGVGSGCIAVSILAQLPQATAKGVDISPIAIALSKRNAGLMHVADRLDLELGDLFGNASDTRFDAIVSNPPYVPEADIAGLQPEVKDFEPHLALTDGGNGLSIIERIVKAAPDLLMPGGALILEFGFGQSDQVAKMFDPPKWASVQIKRDFRSIERMVLAKAA